MPLHRLEVEKLVKKTIKRFNMLLPGETIIVGVSGGSDSLALLLILRELEEYRLNLIIAHLNHGIRYEEGKRDAEFVEGTARMLRIPFELGEVDTLGFKKESKTSLEEAARILRYKFFRETLEKYQAQKVATGHTLDDQAETVLMNFMRGSGPQGLSGIPPVSEGYIIRPLLEVSRQEIKDYLRTKGITWIEDSTNRAKDFLRNKIRHELIPELRKYNPRIKETLSRTANILRIEEDFIKSRAKNWFEYVFQSVDANELLGTISHYKAIPEALRSPFLRIAIKELKGDLRKISFNHVVSVDEFLLSEIPSGEISLPDRVVVAKGYNLFLITRKSELKREFSHTISLPGKWSFPDVEFEVEITKVESLSEDKSVGLFNADSVEFPIEVRNFCPGDRFIPLGMQTFKKVKRFFIDEKVPKFLRQRIPIFLSRGEIMWIGGMRIDERFRVREDKAVKIRIIRPLLTANKHEDGGSG